MSFDIDAMTAQVKAKSNRVKWIGGIAAAIVLGPVVWWLVSAVLGIIALGTSLVVAAVLTLLVINLWPIFLDRLATMKIKLIVAEATRNPVETFKKDQEAEKRERDQYDTSITKYEGSINNIKNLFRQQSKVLDPGDIAQFQSDIEEMEADLQGQKDELVTMDQALALKDREIKRLEASWKLATTIGDTNAQFNANRIAKAARQIATDAALASVNQSVADARAALAQRVRNRKSGPGAVSAIANDPSPSVADVFQLESFPVGKTTTLIPVERTK